MGRGSPFKKDVVPSVCLRLDVSLNFGENRTPGHLHGRSPHTHPPTYYAPSRFRGKVGTLKTHLGPCLETGRLKEPTLRHPIKTGHQGSERRNGTGDI